MGKIIHTTNLSALGSQALADSDIMLVQKQTGVAIKTTLTELKSYIGGVTPPTQTHTVRFKVGSVIYATQSVVHGGSASRPADPDYQNCPVAMQYKTFLNWVGDYTNVVSDVDITASCDDNVITVNVTDKVHTYDGYTAHQYTVVSQLNHGGTASVSYSTDGVNYQTSWPGNYIDIGRYTVWYKVTAVNYPDKTGVEDLIIAASSTHTVTFTVDGVKYDEQQVAHGGNASLPATPTYQNCDQMIYKTFKSWNGSYTNVTEDRTLIAVYDDNTIGCSITDTVITYDGNYHTFNLNVSISPDAPYEVQYSTDTSEPKSWSSTKPSFKDVNVQGYPFSVKITATNYQTYETDDAFIINERPVQKWTVSFKNDEGGYVKDAYEVVDGYALVATDVPADPAKSGWTFKAWQKDGTDTNPVGYVVTSNVTFIARFEKDTETHNNYFENPSVTAWDTVDNKCTIVDSSYPGIAFSYNTAVSSIAGGQRWTVIVSAGTLLGQITNSTGAPIVINNYIMKNYFQTYHDETADPITITYYSNY